MRRMHRVVTSHQIETVWKNQRLFVEEHRLTYDGESKPVSRLSSRVGDGVGILVLHKDSFVMTRQYRHAVNQTLIEIPAGLVHPGSSETEAAIRETVEEIGYRPSAIREIARFYASPGCLSQLVTLFFSEVSDRDNISEGGGTAHDHEFIDIVRIHLADAMEFVRSGVIRDAKTIIAIQWFYDQCNRRA